MRFNLKSARITRALCIHTALYWAHFYFCAPACLSVLRSVCPANISASAALAHPVPFSLAPARVSLLLYGGEGGPPWRHLSMASHWRSAYQQRCEEAPSHKCFLPQTAHINKLTIQLNIRTSQTRRRLLVARGAVVVRYFRREEESERRKKTFGGRFLSLCRYYFYFLFFWHFSLQTGYFFTKLISHVKTEPLQQTSKYTERCDVMGMNEWVSTASGGSFWDYLRTYLIVSLWDMLSLSPGPFRPLRLFRSAGLSVSCARDLLIRALRPVPGAARAAPGRRRAQRWRRISV